MACKFLHLVLFHREVVGYYCSHIYQVTPNRLYLVTDDSLTGTLDQTCAFYPLALVSYLIPVLFWSSGGGFLFFHAPLDFDFVN